MVDNNLPIRGICTLNTGALIHKSLHGTAFINKDFTTASDVHGKIYNQISKIKNPKFFAKSSISNSNHADSSKFASKSVF
jgi:hypothetical protein